MLEPLPDAVWFVLLISRNSIKIDNLRLFHWNSQGCAATQRSTITNRAGSQGLGEWLSVHQRVASVTIHQPWQGHCLYKLYIPWCTSHHILQQFLLVWQWVSKYFLDLFACHDWILSTPTLSGVFWLSVSCRIVDPTVFVVFRVIDCFAMSQEHTEHPGYECRHAMKFISSFSVDDIANQADVPSQVHPEQGESYPRESCHRGSLGASWQPSAQSESKMWSYA